MTQITNTKQYNLEERTYNFAKRIISFVGALPKTLTTVEIGKQLIRAAGSVGANYIEANESLGRKDFMMKLKISKKESKEARYWLRLLEVDDTTRMNEKLRLLQEAEELTKIFGSIIERCK